MKLITCTFWHSDGSDVWEGTEQLHDLENEQVGEFSIMVI